MKVSRKKTDKEKAGVALSSLNGGDVFHFANVDFDEAIAEDCMFVVAKNPLADKDGRVTIMNLTDGQIMKRDGCHLVVERKAVLGVTA